MQQPRSHATALAEDVRRVQQIDPDFWAVHTALGVLHRHRKEFDAARREFELGVELSGGMPLALGSLGDFHAARRERPEAERVIARLQARPYSPPYYIASIYRRLGDTAPMFEWLERGFEERNGGMIDLHYWGEPWKSHPRFQELLRRMKAASR
jgi:hypothetical protein